MKKHLYIVRGQEQEPLADFASRMRSLGEAAAARPEVSALKYVVTEEPRPRLSIIPFLPGRIAAFSAYQQSEEPVSVIQAARGLGGIYLAEEAFPVQYEKTWANGQPSPGVGLLTLFRRKPGLDYDTFLHRWHNGHTPLSLRLHPLWHYGRNVLREAIHPESEPWDGLVDEYVKTRSDLLNPYRFFGGSVWFPYHMWQVYKDVKGFLDYRGVETYLVREYHLK